MILSQPDTTKMAKEKSEKKGTRKLSPYNKFMKTELQKVKEKNSSLSHKDAFKLAASNWKTSPDNPINSKEKAK
ncbi:Protein YABBY 2 [Zancudomyces culisetae]|uniref:Protein YABBY 2 n=1 Tax=Zancudomyces culisetae TaxID=1213189 RepID=A0A1R1PUJ2_ZANCU|nr:Protein YABBY 2 [Zancudomyces culisetae]|eukprot:OMH84624.1 Protein YABBY 2 [Zancudomyces culisetae]